MKIIVRFSENVVVINGPKNLTKDCQMLGRVITSHIRQTCLGWRGC